MSGRTLQLSLPDDLAAEIAGAVARGEYGSENDMVVGASRSGSRAAGPRRRRSRNGAGFGEKKSTPDRGGSS